MASAKDFDSSSSVLAFFGAELRRLRDSAGLTQERLGEIVNYTGSLVGMVETARRSPSKEFAERCDAALGGDGTLARLWPLVNSRNFPTWFREYVELEATARKVYKFQVLHIPGLLQTRDYARALFRVGLPGATNEQIESRVTARLDRQAILTRSTPPLFWAVMDEGVIRRTVGGPNVMRAQLAHLLDMSEAPNVVLQIAPFDLGEKVAFGNAITVMTMPDGHSVVYAEGLGVGTILSEPDEVDTWSLRYDLLRADALPPEASIRMIRAAMEGLDS